MLDYLDNIRKIHCVPCHCFPRYSSSGILWYADSRTLTITYSCFISNGHTLDSSILSSRMVDVQYSSNGIRNIILLNLTWCQHHPNHPHHDTSSIVSKANIIKSTTRARETLPLTRNNHHRKRSSLFRLFNLIPHNLRYQSTCQPSLPRFR